ncbi:MULTISPECIES: Gfo/Idh/MocA family oxidoreductase [unclassified Enterococcus]|uniref:Gfo/Idh/MocA family protein n=1 Tax=unclassified Enterococcus TaxID=2608891 RepID=UPI0015571E41|nr:MULTISPECIES: Gfo/Idh/MocA family oxidoreductase [unclassified Enterococcus]MBS7577476.1 Gfo/Idh/MocA family oxidoreductase [Enterococcus sp. MMGLQ5-2]MBS7584882.1 Gfo/Idh/MocA family oxidoreductase [Enterococcus sp. MMGLQ5-1]NPD12737.1 Gfo/Idh/MocA family oxidoreductase [Enterococcus sp. MMGLQ5-1]NPD37308.1 Gfo/Idh/MocA family oxidoreductase [Enterococcus sp. MMGLQ5-2]
MSTFNWGIIGSGWIAGEMAATLNQVHGEIYAITSQPSEALDEFVAKHQIKHLYTNLEEMLKDDALDIVYVATPHHLHAEMIEASLKAGKHVLCEKAITINSRQLEYLLEIAREKNLILMEAMTVFHMPIFKKLSEKVNNGLLGEIKLLQINFGSHKEYDVKNRFFNPNLAGGALLDIGGYATSVARLFLKSQPELLMTTVNYFETGVDEESATILKNKEGQMAAITLTMQAKQPKRALIAGEKGYLEIYDYPRGNKAYFTETLTGQTVEIEAGEQEKALAYEVYDFEGFIQNADLDGAIGLTLDVMKILDKIREEWGFVYPFEVK